MKRAPKRLSAVVAMIAIAIIVPASLNAWGPSRTTYTIAHPADKITFNSITDNPAVGDERNFVVVKDAANTADGGWQDNITVQPGKEYLVRVYVHNNAASSLNLKAENTRVSASVPTTTGKSVSVSGFVTADNSDPKQVWDDIHFNSTSNFNLAYVSGSAEIWNNGYATTGQPLPDSIVTSAGALIGYNGPNGEVPGCFQYANYVYFKIKPQFAPTDTFQTTKQVRKLGDTNWSKSVNANPNDTLQYQITYKNAGEVNEYNVVVKDTLPAGITYIPGSTILTNPNNPSGVVVNNDVVASTGMNIGSYKPGSIAYVQFNAKVSASSESLTCGPNTFVNKERTTANGGYIDDTANTVVTKTCTPNKINVCDLSSKQIVTIDETSFDSSKYSKNLDDCKVPQQLSVCEIATKKIVTINASDFDSAKYSKNLDDCKVPQQLSVCEIATKKIVTINASDFDSAKYTKDLNVCSVTPPELPHTGPTENIVAFLGLGAIATSVIYYIRSRRIGA
jgi:uncharacterized repeat protein (TIGR01451 family)